MILCFQTRKIFEPLLCIKLQIGIGIPFHWIRLFAPFENFIPLQSTMLILYMLIAKCLWETLLLMLFASIYHNSLNFVPLQVTRDGVFEIAVEWKQPLDWHPPLHPHKKKTRLLVSPIHFGCFLLKLENYTLKKKGFKAK
jgi:hypothetical protein